MNNPDQRRHLGRCGETLAARFLRQERYRILHTNVRCPLGELDLIARDGDTTVFVEVRTRTDAFAGLPAETISRRKQVKLRQLAMWYLSRQGSLTVPCRFDVVSVILAPDRPAEISLIRDAF